MELTKKMQEYIFHLKEAIFYMHVFKMGISYQENVYDPKGHNIVHFKAKIHT